MTTNDDANLGPAISSVAPGMPDLAGPHGEKRLIAGRCTECGTLTLPANGICPNCWTEAEPEPVHMSEQGVLYTYTVVRNAPPGFEAPYVIGYVDLPEGLRVMARRDGELPEGVRPNARVSLYAGAIQHEDSGGTVYGPCFEFEGGPGGAS